MQSTQANVKQREMIDMKTSWHAFISGYICCRIYMITIETHIDFLYLFFFLIHLSPPISSQLSRYLLLMSEWSHTDVRESQNCLYAGEVENKSLWPLQNGKTIGLDMIISSTDIDQRQGACLVEGKHLKAFKPFKFHFKRFIFFVLLEKINRLKKYCQYHWMMQHIKLFKKAIKCLRAGPV